VFLAEEPVFLVDFFEEDMIFFTYRDEVEVGLNEWWRWLDKDFVYKLICSTCNEALLGILWLEKAGYHSCDVMIIFFIFIGLD
jgi:hypothetical protein